jgi:diguanylate cyclase (GGDEF)-like protein/PAS domain S-box-containing protein
MRPRTLTGRFVVTMVVVATSMATLAAAVTYQLTAQRAAAETRAALDGLITATADTLTAGVYANDATLLTEMVNVIERHPQIDAALVLDVNGAEIAVAGSAGRQLAALAAGTTSSAGEILMERDLQSPFDADERIGRLIVQADARQLRSSVRQQALLVGLALVVLIAALALALYALAMRLLVRPMTQLAHELAVMRPGTSHRISLRGPDTSDEINTVVDAANRLLDANETALASERDMRTEVAAMEARYRQIFDDTSAGIFLLTPQYRLVNSNRAIAFLIGATDADLAQMQDDDFIQRLFSDPEYVHNMVSDAVLTGQTTSSDLELRSLDGSTRWVHCLISVQGLDDRSDGHLIEGVIYDVTQRRVAESQTAYLAEHDALTGLKSRAFFQQALHHYVERARSIHASVTLIFIDLDHFKSVNDTHGHVAGDRVLVECAQRIRNLAHRSTDLAVRLGGDEFTIVLDGVGAEDPAAVELAASIVSALSAPIEIGPDTFVQIGASVGVAGFPLHARQSDELVRAADQAMYAAKRAGRSSWFVAGKRAALTG